MSNTVQTFIENFVSNLEERGYDVQKVKIADDLITIWFDSPFDMTGELSFDPKILGIV